MRKYFSVSSSAAVEAGCFWCVAAGGVGRRSSTFGIGIDYAINVEERLRRKAAGGLVAALAEVGPPVALASATTILGYASLLTADNQALVSFGSLAILGEATCLAAALVLVPALSALRGRAVPVEKA